MKKYEVTYWLPTVQGIQRIIVQANGGYAAVKIVESMFPTAKVSSSCREVR